MGKGMRAVVDGANIAYVEKTKDGRPKVSNLIAVRRKLDEEGYDALIIVDASLRHEVDDPDQLEGLIDNQRVRQAPAGTDADFFILQVAEDEQALVISNDQYEPYKEQFPWIKQRRVPVMIIDGDAHLYEPNIEANGHKQASG